MDLLKKPRVMIGTPIRDRAFIIREFLEAIDDLDYPHDRIELNLKFNNIGKKDTTPNEVKDWMNDTNALDRYDLIHIGNTDFPNPPPNRSTERYSELIQNLCTLRNWIRRDFLNSKCDYLLDIDSDQILNKDSLKRLVGHKKDIVGAITKIPYSGSGIWCWNFYSYDEKTDDFTHYRHQPSGKLEEVDSIGGIVLYSRKAIEEVGAKMPGRFGEDYLYHLEAKKKGFQVYADTGEEVAHVWKYPNGQIIRTYGGKK